jgi:hypothetical protein
LYFLAAMVLGAIHRIIKRVGAKMAGINARPTGDDHADLGEFLLGDEIGGQGGAEDCPLDGFGINALDYRIETGKQGLKKIIRVGGNLDLADKLPAVEKNDVGMGAAYI